MVRGYKCECGEKDCDQIFYDKDYEVGSEQTKNCEDWVVIHPLCTHKLNLFPIFYHPCFMIGNLARTDEWIWAHPISLATV